MQEDIKFLKELQQELKTQENDSQAAPRFWTIMDYEYNVTEKGYHDRISVYDPSTAESYEVIEYAKMILEDGDIEELQSILDGDDYFKEDYLVEWIEDNRESVQVIYETKVALVKQNTLFITKEEAKSHLKLNSHHYSDEAHTYAMTAWRAPKVERLFKILESFDWDSI